MNVVCCLWGDWPAPGWGERYVARLREGVRKHLTLPHRFIVYADNPDRLPGYDVRPLNPPSWKGCLPKIYVHGPEAALEGRVLLLDLDNVITGSLDEIAAYDGPLCVRAWFAGWDRGEVVADGDMIAFEAGAPESRCLWDALASDPMGVEDETGGRERFLIRGMVKPDLWQQIVPGQIVSYKNHVIGRELPEDARIVSFHGHPRPHTIKDKWLKEAWG